MSFLTWLWRIVLALVAASFVTTVYYMTHDVDIGVALPVTNIIAIAGVALLGVLWTIGRRYWYTLIMLIALGLLRGLFNEELLTNFQSPAVFIAGGFVAFILLVVLIARVILLDRAKKADEAAKAALWARMSGPAAMPAAPAPAVVAAAPSMPLSTLVTTPAPPVVPPPTAAETAPAPAADSSKVAPATATEVKVSKRSARKSAKEVAKAVDDAAKTAGAPEEELSGEATAGKD
jgi:hypothetical protein